MKADGTVPAKGFIANYTRVSETTTMLLILIHTYVVFLKWHIRLLLSGLRRQNCDRGDGRADVAQLSSLLGGGRGVRLGHRRRQTLWVFI